MPTYRNNADGPRPLKWGNHGSIVPAGGTVDTDKYVPNLSDFPDFELITYSAAPWVKLRASSPGFTLTGLAGYAKIRITNDSGSSVSIVANEDASNDLVVLTGSIETIRQDMEIEKLVVTGTGTSGNVYVHGFKG